MTKAIYHLTASTAMKLRFIVKNPPVNTREKLSTFTYVLDVRKRILMMLSALLLFMQI